MSDPGESLRAAQLGSLNFIESAQCVQSLAAQFPRHSLGIADIQNGITLGSALDSLKDRGKESASPRVFSGTRLDAAGDHHHESWQILILRSQSVGDPRTHGGTALPRRTCKKEKLSGRMVELVRIHGPDDAHFVCDTVKVRDGVGEPCAAAAVLGEGAGRSHQLGLSLGECEFLSLNEFVRAVLTRTLHQFRLVVEQIQMGWGSGTVNIDYSLGFGFKMGLACHQRIFR